MPDKAPNTDYVVKTTLKSSATTDAGKMFDKNLAATNSRNNVDLTESDEIMNEIDLRLDEKQGTFKKKIWDLSKMEALVHSDPKLESVYQGMEREAEENQRYGYHWNEAVLNIMFNDYVLNSSTYLQKYKMAIPKEKKRRDKSGIKQQQRAGEDTMKKKGIDTKNLTVNKSPSNVPENYDHNNSLEGVMENWAGDVSDEPNRQPVDQSNQRDYLDHRLKRKYDTMNEHHLQSREEKESFIYKNKPNLVMGQIKSLSDEALDKTYNDIEGELGMVDEPQPKQEPKFGAVDAVGEIGDAPLDETTSAGGSAGSAGGQSRSDGYQYSGPFGKPQHKKGINTSFWDGGEMVKETNYLTNPLLFEHIYNKLNEDAMGLEGDSVVPIAEKSTTKKQQKFMGMVHAAQKGELDDPSASVEKVAKEMKPDDVEDFASTKHKGLPEKVKTNEDDFNSELVDKYEIKINNNRFDYGKGINIKTVNGDNLNFDWISPKGSVLGRYNINKEIVDPPLDGIMKLNIANGYPQKIDNGSTNKQFDEGIAGKAIGGAIGAGVGMRTGVGAGTGASIGSSAGDAIQNKVFGEGIRPQSNAEIYKEKRSEGMNPDEAADIVIDNMVKGDRSNLDDNTISNYKELIIGAWEQLVSVDEGDSFGVDNRISFILKAEKILHPEMDNTDLRDMGDRLDIVGDVGIDKNRVRVENELRAKGIDPQTISEGIISGDRSSIADTMKDVPATPMGGSSSGGGMFEGNEIDEDVRIRTKCKKDEEPVKGKPINQPGGCKKKKTLEVSPEEKKRSPHNIKSRQKRIKKQETEMENKKKEQSNILNISKKELAEQKSMFEAILGEDKKSPSLVNVNRLGKENKKNFIKDKKDSTLSDIVDTQDELSAMAQIEEVGENPYDLGEKIEAQKMKDNKMESLENEGDSTNDDNKHIPKRNLTSDEDEQVSLMRNGMHSLVYDNKPSDRFEERMERDMGEEIYALRKKQMEFKGNAPMYNKDAQPTEDTEVETDQYNKYKKGYITQFGESVVTGKYKNEFNKNKFINFKLNEAEKLKVVDDTFTLINLDGLGNRYSTKIEIVEGIEMIIKTAKYYIKEGKVFVNVPKKKSINENKKVEKKLVNEGLNKMKKLWGYDPSKFTETKHARNLIK